MYCIYGFNKEKLLEINALRRLKMLFQRSYSSKSSGEACPRTPLAARAFGARDCPPQLSINPILLQHCGVPFVSRKHTKGVHPFCQKWYVKG